MTGAGTSSDGINLNPESQTWIPGRLPVREFAKAAGDESQSEDQSSVIDPTPSLHSNLSSQSGMIGDFKILKEIGRGGMGVVYEALQRSLQRRVALKILPLAGRLDQRQIQRFQNEARAAAQLNHPNIVPVYAVGFDAGCHYYAMQLIEGHDLAHFIRQARNLVDSKVVRRSGDTPPLMNYTTLDDNLKNANAAGVDAKSREHSSSAASFPSAAFIEMMCNRKSSATHEVFGAVVQIGINAAEALHHAHQLGIVHRDIKPSNLLLDNSGSVWVTDFGLAQIQGAGALTMTGEVIGTLRYMSPEQPLGQRVLVDQRTDIYSLGVTLYEMLTLKRAYNGEEPKEIIRQVCFDDPAGIRRLNPRIPVDLETVILKAISKSPDDRYQTAQEFADDLRRFRDDQPILARRPTLMQQTRRWIRRHVGIATAIAIAGCIVCITSVVASGMIWNSLTAETRQRKRVESLLDKSEGLRLTANSALIKDENPGLALLLAVKGAELNPGVDANSALLHAFNSNHEVRTFSPREQFTDSFCVSPDGKRVVTVVPRSFKRRESLPAIESSLDTGESLRNFDNGTAITSAAYSPDSRHLLTTSSLMPRPASAQADPDLQSHPDAGEAVPVLWDAVTGANRFSFNDAALDVVLGTEFSPTGDRLVLPGKDNSVLVYTASNGLLAGSFKGHLDKVISTAFSSDGKRLISISKDNTVRIWEADTGVELRQFAVNTEPRHSLTAVFAGNTDTIVISSDEGTRFLSVESGEQLNPLHFPEHNASVSRNGELVALYSRYGRNILIRETKSFNHKTTIDVDEQIISANFDEDSRLLLVVTLAEPRVYRVEDGMIQARFRGHTDRILSGRFVPGSRNVITTSRDATVRYWSVKNGSEFSTLAERPALAIPLPSAVSEDSTQIAVPLSAAWHTELRDASGKASTSLLDGRLNADAYAEIGNAERLVTFEEHKVIVWHGPSSRRIATLQLESSFVSEARVIPATDAVLVMLQSGKALLWNTLTNQRIDLGDSRDTIRDFSIHPHNGQVAIALTNGDCLILDGKTGVVLKTLAHEQEVLFVLFSPSGSRMLTVDSRNAVRLWIPEQNTPVQTFQEPGVECEQAAFSTDEKAVLTWGVRNKDGLRSWRCDTGELIQKTPAVELPRVVIHPSSSIAAVASYQDGLFIWNFETGEYKQLTNSSSASPQFVGASLVAIEAASGFQVSRDPVFGYGSFPEFCRSSIVTRDIMSGEILNSQTLAVEPWKLIVDPDSGQQVFSYRTHDFALIQLADGQQSAIAGNHAGPIVFQEFVGKLRKIVCASMDGTVSLWDPSGRRLHLLQEHQHPILNASLSADGLTLATYDASGAGFLWNMEDGARITALPGRSGAVHTVRFFHSGKRLMTASEASSVRIFDLITRAEESIPFDSAVVAADLSPNDRQLLVITTTSEDNINGAATQQSKVFIRDIETDRETNLHMEDPPQIARFSPDGGLAAVLSSNGALRLFETVRGSAVQNINFNRRPIFNFAFSPEGRDLIVRHDGELSLWDLHLRDEYLRIPEIRRQELRSGLSIQTDWAPFSPDGHWILTTTPSLKKWPRNPLEFMAQRVPRSMTNSEIRRFSLITPSESSSVK